ncbi:MAG: cytochrome c peroxidase [Bacteroidia bacterium]
MRVNKIPYLFIAFITLSAAFYVKNDKTKFVIPKGWPKPHYYFKNNPLTLQGFELGKQLFYDPILSSDSTINCASCHLSFTAFTHADHRVSHGIQGLLGTRNSPTLINLAWNTSFMWDGSVTNLEEQVINPITNPVEMNSKLSDVIVRLNKSHTYKMLFYKVFNDSLITTQNLFKSLAQFTGNLVSCNSKYDSIMRKEKNVAFTVNELNGYNLFKKNCASCHAEPLFTNYSFENNGLAMDSALKDIGRMKITNNATDSLKFKVPTLRNIEFSAPYFHDGRFNKLKEAIEHYTSGIVDSPTLAKQLKNKINLTKEEKKDLLAFLKTLTDKPFLYNIQFRQKVSS